MPPSRFFCDKVITPHSSVLVSGTTPRSLALFNRPSSCGQRLPMKLVTTGVLFASVIRIFGQEAVL